MLPRMPLGKRVRLSTAGPYEPVHAPNNVWLPHLGTALDVATASAVLGMVSSSPQLPQQQQQHSPKSTTNNNNVEIDVFLDFACPFSAKMWKTLEGLTLPAGFNVSVRLVPQPWHAHSSWLAECALVASHVGGESAFEAFCRVNFAHQDEFAESVVDSLTRTQVQTLVMDLMAKEGVIKDVPAAMGMLKGGNTVLVEFKQHVRFHRMRGVHVTPTVHVNGLEATAVSSSWTAQQWYDLFGSLQR